MRNRDEFKAELLRRREAYERRRKRKQKLFLAAALPLVSCAAVFCVAFLPALLRGFQEGTAHSLGEAALPESAAAQSVEIAAFPPANEPAERYTDPDVIRDLLARLEAAESLPAATASAEPAAETGYSIRVICDGETAERYTFLTDGSLRTADGSWRKMPKEAAEELERLISELQMD